MPNFTWLNPAAAELAWHVTFRGPTFYTKTFFTFLVAATICVDLLPLFMTGTSSYGAANKVCYDRFSLLRTAWYADPESQYYDSEWDVDAKESATRYLFPVHLFNSISIGVSLFGFWVWLFFSPHKKSDAAQNLDRTCKLRCVSFRSLSRDFIFCFL